MEIPPIIPSESLFPNTPTPESTTPSTPRIRGAWTTLFLIFAVLVGLSVAQFFWPSSKLSNSYDDAISALRNQVLSDSVSQAFTGTGAASKTDEFPPSLLKSLDKPAVAKLYATMRYEAGKPIAPEAIGTLQKSSKPIDQTWAKIYAPKTLTLAEAHRLADALPSETFLNRVARMHALKKAGDPRASAQVVSPTRRWVSIIAMLGVLFFCGVGVLLWVFYFAQRSSGKLVPLGHPSGVLSPADADRYAFRVAQMLGVYVLASLVVSSIKGLPGAASEAIAYAILLASIPILALLPIGGKRIVTPLLGWTTQDLGKNILWGLAALCANLPVFLFLSVLSLGIFSFLPHHQHPVITVLQSGTDIPTIIVLSAMAAIGAPIFEETLFRGTLLPAMATRFGSIATAVVVSSFLFAGLHPTGPPSWLPLAGIGAMNCLLTYQTKSLIPAVILHAGFNFTTVLLVLTMT